MDRAIKRYLTHLGVLAVVFVCTLALAPAAHAANTGFLTAGTSTAVTASAGNNNGFETTPQNVTANDAAYAQDVNSGTGNATDGCTTFPQAEDDQHDFFNFGINVPADANIDGIEVQTDASVDGAAGTNVLCVALSWDGGATWTSAKATPDIGTSDQTNTLGGSADTWGRTWSVAELSNANFKLRVMPDSSSSNARDYFLDYLAIQVHYSVPVLTQSGYRFFKNTDSADLVSAVSNPSTSTDEINALALDPAEPIRLYAAGFDAAPGSSEWRIEKRRTGDNSLVYAVTEDISSGADEAKGIALDTASSTMYVVGTDAAPGDIEWRIESRDTTDGSLLYSVASNPSSNVDRATAVSLDKNGGVMYVVGKDSSVGASDQQWRVEKRNVSDGSLAYTVTNNPSSGDDEINAIAIDTAGGAMYLAGSDVTPGNSQWRIEKRNLSNGSLVYSTTTNYSTGNDFAAAIALNTASGTMYIAGRDIAPGDAQWRIEARNLSDGSLVFTTTSNPSANIDIPGGISIDTASGAMYVAGRTDAGWRVEKRLLSDGSFVTAFGTNGVLTSDPSANVDGANAVVLSPSRGDIYAGGFDQVMGSGNRQWRLERRDTADGSSPWGAVLAPRDTPATAPPRGTPFRLRTLVHVATSTLKQSGQDFKLQFAPRSGTCDTGFSGETYADVTATTSIQYADNPGPVNGTALVPKNSDPDHGADTLVDETYQESNNFTNSIAAIPVGQDGKWDFALVASGTPAGTSYCFRVVKSGGSLLDTYGVIPEITTRATLSVSTDNVFEIGQATTSVPTLTIVAATSTGGAITAANDIRIKIASSSVSMQWNTASSSVTLGGTAAGKVSSTVSFPDAYTVLLGVNTNFAEGETLTVDGLSVSGFTAANAAASPFELFIDGASDSEADDVSDKKATIRGKFTLADVPGGGKANTFDIGGTSATGVELLEFRLVPTGEQATTTQVAIELYDVVGFASSSITNAQLLVDANGSGTIDAGETQAVGGAGAVSELSGGAGTITFGAPFVVTSTLNLILRADIASIDEQDVLKARVRPSGITASGKKSQVLLVPAGSALPVLHAKPFRHRGGGAGAEGGAPGGGSTGGGGSSGGGSGEGSGNFADFFLPTATGSPLNEWTNGGNAFSSDDAYATTGVLNSRQDYADFGFNIPSGSTIAGIEVSIEASAAIADTGPVDISLSWNAGTNYTAVKSTPTLTTSDTNYTLGGATDTWGRAWSSSEFSNANLRLRVTSQLLAVTARVDVIRMKVHYFAGGGGGGGGGGGAP
jgi:hypothetical protein